ncbi:hypothetical protein SY88_10730 [Clostridiales bacterium PH28_bin88]|nr:hypothetical protein SY88_10730 [Clostridiales bacterium PH28_bin88]
MYVRVKQVKGHQYYYLQHSKKEEGKVKSVHVAYLGKYDTAVDRLYEMCRKGEIDHRVFSDCLKQINTLNRTKERVEEA